jgi:transcription elongation GreA/GreB family factor
MGRDKSALRDALLTALKSDLSVLEKAMAAAREGATHEEAKPENDKDTRALEASYLARGQALRVRELQEGVRDVETMALRDFSDGSPAALGACIEVEQDGEAKSYFLAPHGGGISIDGVHVVTPKSPLGKALLGAREGDEREVMLGGKARSLSIVGVK